MCTYIHIYVHIYTYLHQTSLLTNITVPSISGTQEVLGWGGVLVQATPDAVRSQRVVPPGGVYVSYRFHGSPASRYFEPLPECIK